MMFRRVSDPNVLNQLNEPDMIVKQRKALWETIQILKQAKKLFVKDSRLNKQFKMDNFMNQSDDSKKNGENS